MRWGDELYRTALARLGRGARVRDAAGASGADGPDAPGVAAVRPGARVDTGQGRVGAVARHSVGTDYAVRCIRQFSIPLRTGTGPNEREGWQAKQRRVKRERKTTAWACCAYGPAPVPPVIVLMTRVGPSNGLDDDNLRGSLKAVRDEVCVWLLGCSDDRSPLIDWRYSQRRGRQWEVIVEIGLVRQPDPMADLT